MNQSNSAKSLKKMKNWHSIDLHEDFMYKLHCGQHYLRNFQEEKKKKTYYLSILASNKPPILVLPIGVVDHTGWLYTQEFTNITTI